MKSELIEEKRYIDEKISRLRSSISSEIFFTLPSDAQNLIARQLKVMQEYSGILGDRINAVIAS